MSELFWPGDERAGDLMSDAAFLRAMVRVEATWLDALVDAGVAPGTARADLAPVIGEVDVAVIARGAEPAGNPVVPLLALLRGRIGEVPAVWLHRGLTSQDVLDTALVLVLRDALDRLAEEVRAQVGALAGRAEQHVGTAMVGRTLTQQAVPTTFGAVVAAWLDGVLDAAEQLAAVRAGLPVQLGGAVGTLSALTELVRQRHPDDPAEVVADVVKRTAAALGLPVRRPWHTSRGPVTRAGDVLVGCTDAWGRIATDVCLLARTEIAEVGEPQAQGRGVSSTMPHKHNPVLSILIRRAAIAAPGLGSTLHLAAALAGDQRPDGAWHAEWATLATLGRRAVVAASQTTELVVGLQVDAERMRTTLQRAAEVVLAECRATAALVGGDADPDPTTYLGITDDLVRGAVERARVFLEDNT